MKSLLSPKTIFLLCTFLLAHIAYGGKHAHDDNGPENVMYFSGESDGAFEKTLDGAFEHHVFNPKEGSLELSPLGNSSYPYSVMGSIGDRIFVPKTGKFAFKLKDIKAAFPQFRDVVEEAYESFRFYAEEDDMIFLKEDGKTVTSAEHAVYVVIPNMAREDVLAELKVKWNECKNPHFRGRYYALKTCSTTRVMNDKFRVLLEENLLNCVNEGLRAQRKDRTKGVYIVHAGTAGDENHRSYSLHNRGRAIDLKEFYVNNYRKKTYKISYAQGIKGKKTWLKFFQKFRTCWGKVQLRRSKSCSYNNMKYNTRKKLPYYGSIGWEDRKHKKHLHLSMPVCGKGGKRAGVSKV